MNKSANFEQKREMEIQSTNEMLQMNVKREREIKSKEV